MGLSRLRRTVGMIVATALAATGLTLAAGPASAGISTNPPEFPSTDARVCPGFSGLNTTNPYASVTQGLYRPTTAFASVDVVDAAWPPSTAWGQPVPVTMKNWTANSSFEWRSWFASLKWLGALIYIGGGRKINPTDLYKPTTDERWDALDYALGVTHAYLTHYPNVATAPDDAQKSSYGHRAQFLACLVEAMGVENAPSWLITSARAHAAYLNQSANYLGAWNQGFDQDLGMLAIGCTAGPTSYRDAAVTRLTAGMPQAIGSDGVPVEQAPGYNMYQYQVWAKVLGTYAGCGLPSTGTIPTLIAKVPAFLAQATQPDGTLAQIGDTYAVAPLTVAATTYAASKGTTGTAPTQRVAIYSPSGFIFGRSTWSPFTSASFYSLRFGPKVDQHGHNDRTALTWMLAGKHRLVDAGHVGYTNTTVRTWLRTPEAHNLLSADQYVGFRLATGAQAKGSSLRYSRTSSRADSFVVDAQAYAWNTASTGWHWTSQRRSVLVARGPDLLVVRDTAGGAPKAVTWRQHWHVPPGWTARTVTSNKVEAAYGTSLRTTFLRIPTTRGALAPVLAASTQSPTAGVVKKNVDVQFPSSGIGTGLITVIAPVAAGSVSATLTGSTLTIVSAGVKVVVQINADGSLTRL